MSAENGLHPLTLVVNGVERKLKVGPTDTLLMVIRSELGLYGAREGCGVGMCGSCTVLVDGRPVSGCLMPAAAASGRTVTTIEGLEGPGGELHPVQAAYADNIAFQCSYCTPGFVLATKALLDENPDVTEEEARAYLSGNLCRCGSYVKILAAVMDAKERLARNARAR